MEVVDLSHLKRHNKMILNAARRALGNDAYAVQTPQGGDLPSEIRDRDGETIAYGWFDADGRPEFKPWCSRCSN